MGDTDRRVAGQQADVTADAARIGSKATTDGTVVADAPESDLVTIEGNYYFPPSSLSAGVFSDSPTPLTDLEKPLPEEDQQSPESGMSGLVSAKRFPSLQW